MHGLHLTADLHACTPGLPALSDAATLQALCLAEVDAAGLHAVNALFHPFEPQAAGAGSPGGVTGVVLLAESHLAVHTWPELRAVTLDVYVCNRGADNTARAERLADALVAAFGAGRVERHRLRRGSAPAEQPA